MRTLLDTCVISELRRPDANPRVREHLAEMDPDDLFISVITIGELTKGVELLPHGKRRRELESWLHGLAGRFNTQILPIDHEAATIWGEITARAQTQGVQIPASDGLIAATGIRHGLQVMTRNTRDFAASGARIIDPWQA